jgi:formylglycine-generating enzyme required for sulfatase activity
MRRGFLSCHSPSGAQRRRQALVGVLVALLALVGAGWAVRAGAVILALEDGPSVLTAEREKEKAAKPGSDFKECAAGCPTMVVVPAGTFTMGSPESEKDRSSTEGPQHEVAIAKPFAVGKTEVTFAEWDACVAAGACPKAPDVSWGRDNRPVINVSWDDAKQYTAWLSGITGKKYRLLTEAEWEYAARAGSETRFSFGEDETQLDQPQLEYQDAASWREAPECFWPSRHARKRFGNGSRTLGTTAMRVRQQTDRRGWKMDLQVGGSSAAVPGSTIHSSSARPAAAGTPPT